MTEIVCYPKRSGHVGFPGIGVSFCYSRQAGISFWGNVSETNSVDVVVRGNMLLDPWHVLNPKYCKNRPGVLYLKLMMAVISLVDVGFEIVGAFAESGTIAVVLHHFLDLDSQQVVGVQKNTSRIDRTLACHDVLVHLNWHMIWSTKGFSSWDP